MSGPKRTIVKRRRQKEVERNRRRQALKVQRRQEKKRREFALRRANSQVPPTPNQVGGHLNTVLWLSFFLSSIAFVVTKEWAYAMVTFMLGIACLSPVLQKRKIKKMPKPDVVDDEASPEKALDVSLEGASTNAPSGRPFALPLFRGRESG